MGESARWEPEDLAAITGPLYYGDIPEIAKRLHRSPSSVRAKRSEINRARKARAVCGAFQPDTGVPFAAVMLRLTKVR